MKGKTMKKKATTPAERNPYVQHVRMKRSGAHTKSKKAVRRKEKVQFRKEWG